MLSLVFKPNDFKEKSVFYLVFTNPSIHVHCTKTNTDCVVDTSKEIYNVTVKGIRQTGSSTVRIDNYGDGCKAGTQATLHIPSTHFINVSVKMIEIIVALLL